MIINNYKTMNSLFFLPVISEMASNELHGRPVHDHVMSPDDVLAEERTILKLNMSTVTVADLEVSHHSTYCFILYLFVLLVLAWCRSMKLHLITRSLCKVDSS